MFPRPSQETNGSSLGPAGLAEGAGRLRKNLPLKGKFMAASSSQASLLGCALSLALPPSLRHGQSPSTDTSERRLAHSISHPT